MMHPFFLWLYSAAAVIFFMTVSGMFELLTFPGPPESPPLPAMTAILKEYGLAFGIVCSLFHLWKVFRSRKLTSEGEIEMMAMTISIILLFTSVFVIGAASFFLTPLSLER